jgi:hypothetical protein
MEIARPDNGAGFKGETPAESKRQAHAPPRISTLVWLVWLRAEEGKRAVHRVLHWARGVPTWMQAQRENCSGRTILNRIDRSMAAILREFLDTETDVAPIEEPAEKPTRFYRVSWELETGAAGA